MKKASSLYKFIDLSVVFGTSLLFLVFARFDPEPHHDGIQIAAAVGVSEGLKIHTDVFSQYGPITPWVNGAWLAVTEPTLVSLRYLAAIQLCLIALLMHLIMFALAVRRPIRLFCTFAWILTCPVWAYQKWFFSLWPWPSITYMLTSLGATYLLVTPERSKRGQSRKLIFSGFLLGVSILIRPNYGLVYLSSMFMFVLARRTPRARGDEVRPFVAGLMSAVLITVVGLATKGSIEGWIDQSILGPIGGNSVKNPGFAFFYANYLVGWRKLLILVGLLAGIVLLFRKVPRFGALLMVVSGLFGLDCFTKFDILIPGTWTFQALFVDEFMDPLSGMAPIRIGLLVSVGVLIWMTLNLKLFQDEDVDRRPAHRPYHVPAILACAMGGIAQLYPLPDVYHLWWASPPILVMCGFYFARADKHWFMAYAMFFIPVLGLIGFRLNEQLHIPRAAWTGGILDGMQIDEELLPSYRAAATVLERVNRGASFHCRDGLWAVFQGKYLADSAAYVEWAFGIDETKELMNTSTVWCLDSGAEVPALDGSYQGVLSSGDEELFFSRFSGGYMIHVWLK